MVAGRPRTEPLIPPPGVQEFKRTSYFAALALAGILALLLLYSGRISSEMRDFEVYWTAASRAVGSEPLYRVEDGHFQFKYLPAFALAATPLAALPLNAAKAVWFALSAALLVALLVLSLRLLAERRRPTWLLVTAMLVTMAKFFGHELVLGQVNLLFAVLVVCGILAMERKRDMVAATCFVAAVVVKPYGLLFLPWLAVVRGRRAAASAMLALLIALAAPAVVYGVDGTIALHRAWWWAVTSSTAPNLTNPDNVSVAAWMAKWLGENQTATLTAALISCALLAVASVVIAQGRNVTGREALEGALLLTLVPLLSPQGWDYVFLVATPAVAIIVNNDDRLPTPLRALTWLALAAIGLSIYDVLGRQLYSRFMALSIITPCFLVVVSALTALRLRRDSALSSAPDGDGCRRARPHRRKS